MKKISFSLNRPWKISLGLFSGGLLIVLGFGLIPIATLPNIVIGNLHLQGLTPAEAIAAIDKQSADLKEVEVTADKETAHWQPLDLGITVKAQETVDELVGSNLSQKASTAWKIRLLSYFRPIEATALLSIDEEVLSSGLDEFLDRVNHGDINAELAYKKGEWSVVPAHAGVGIDPQVLRSAVLDRVSHLSRASLVLTPAPLEPKITTEAATLLLPKAQELIASAITLKGGSEVIMVEVSQIADWLELTPPASVAAPATIEANESKIRAFVKTLAENFNQEPIDARVSFENGALKVIQASRNGRILAEGETVELIRSAALNLEKRTVDLPLTTKNPDVSSDSLPELGLKELIGQATTSYVGSPDNRRHNIANGTKYLAGKLLKPGEEFSVVKSLGAVDETTGYLPELVIKENRTIPEYGGGLCQVSTTLFRAALNTGLKITERQNHSYRVSYYERGVGPGLDATIYLPSPDLKFLNDTPGWILIQGAVNTAKSEVTFELYGTKDGRRSVVGKPLVYDITDPPESIYAETSDLATGTTKQIEKAHQGAKTTVTYQVYRGDELLFEQTFKSTYKAWAARYLVGTGTPAGTATVTPSPTPSPSPEPSPVVSESPTPSPSPTPTVTSPSPSPSSTSG